MHTRWRRTCAALAAGLLVAVAAGAQPPDETAPTQEARDTGGPADGGDTRTRAEPGPEERVEARAGQGGTNASTDVVVMSADDRRLSMLIGAPVVDSGGTEIGEIEELILADGSIDAVLAIGGIVGIGERLVLVRWDELDIVAPGAAQGEPQYRAFLRDSTGEQLADSRPEFRYEAE